MALKTVTFAKAMQTHLRTQPTKRVMTVGETRFFTDGRVEVPAECVIRPKDLFGDLLIGNYIQELGKSHNQATVDLMLTAVEGSVTRKARQLMVEAFQSGRHDYAYDDWITKALNALASFQKHSPLIAEVDTSVNVYVKMETHLKFDAIAALRHQKPVDLSVVQRCYFQVTESLKWNALFDEIKLV